MKLMLLVSILILFQISPVVVALSLRMHLHKPDVVYAYIAGVTLWLGSYGTLIPALHPEATALFKREALTEVVITLLLNIVALLLGIAGLRTTPMVHRS